MKHSQLPGMEGALVSMVMKTGEILALTGGLDFALNRFNHVVQDIRQPELTFKPFVFSAALKQGFFPGTLFDGKRHVGTPSVRGRNAWRPRNYVNNYGGLIATRRGLGHSKNVGVVDLMEAAGSAYVHQFAVRFGFVLALNPPGLPLVLDAGATTPMQLTQGYAVFGEGGLVQPRLARKVGECNAMCFRKHGSHPTARGGLGAQCSCHEQPVAGRGEAWRPQPAGSTVTVQHGGHNRQAARSRWLEVRPVRTSPYPLKRRE